MYSQENAENSIRPKNITLVYDKKHFLSAAMKTYSEILNFHAKFHLYKIFDSQNQNTKAVEVFRKL